MNKLKSVLISLQAIKKMLSDEKAGKWPKILLIIAVIYLLLPFDFISDFIPLLGIVDDLLVLFVTITTIGKSYRAYKKNITVS